MNATDIESSNLDATGHESVEMMLTNIRWASRDISLFTFEIPDGGNLPPAEAGAHIGLILPGGLERQYSLVHASERPTAYVVGVKREADGRGGSRAIHDLKVGTRLKVGSPRNNFPLDIAADRTALFAGGIGITPIWCMAQRLDELGRPWVMHYACRSRADAAFLRELEGRPNVHLHFDDEAGSFFPMTDTIAALPMDAHVYCCGPGPMLAAFELACEGRPDALVHLEYFTAKDEAATEGGFVVVLEKSGGEYRIPAGKTILQVLQDAGISVASSCEEGVCGACETRVVSGQPDHRDAILSAQERKESATMMICCSGCKSDRLVLDL